MSVIILYIHFVQSILLHKIDMKICKKYIYWWTDLHIVVIVKKIFSKSLKIWIVLVVRILILSLTLSRACHLTAVARATILVGFHFYQVTATYLKAAYPYIKIFNNPLVLSCFYAGHMLHWDISHLHAKFFWGNINIHLHFMSFLHIDLTQVLKTLPQVRESARGRASAAMILT